MSAPYFIEILSRHGEVKSRQKVEHLPITIGRAYDNDCILDDPHIAAHHAVIEMSDEVEGSLRCRDLGSANGIVYEDQREKIIANDGHLVFRLGKSYLRVRSINYQVKEEIKDDSNQYKDGWRPALLGFIILTILALFDSWLDVEDKFEFISYFLNTVLCLIVATLFCTIWAFISRIFVGHAQFGRHVVTFAIWPTHFWNLIFRVFSFSLFNVLGILQFVSSLFSNGRVRCFNLFSYSSGES